ncbi:hypothetical protein JM16_007826 [Phytophthora kernoviae]|uniref:GAF domain-containing protein n=1 Tax=Phytophthora kernoviae TaxID=325452 RepID=A0A8T0LR13_9STRA|nr:hypothetical protein JM16_007826 [Phytophthora kernoviae]
MSDQEICDDIVATVPKLNAAVARDTYGRRWKQGHRRHGVDVFELSTAAGGEAVDEDRDIAHAVVAKAELRCHLNEVLNVLITHESNVYESTMKALVGKKFKKGDVLFSQRRLLSTDLRRQSMVASRLEMEKEEAPEQALIGVNVATLPVDDALWCNDDKFHLDAMDVDGDTASMTSDSSSVEELTEQLYSNDPSQHSHALEFLGQLVNPAAAQQEYEFVSPSAKRAKSRSKRRKNATKVQQIAQDVENYLSQSLRVMKDRYSNLDQCTVADLEERDYVFDFDAKKTKAEDHPMPPMPAPKKEARRLEAIDQMGVLQPEYDHAALNLVAQVAAKRLNCPIGFVSVVDDENFHAIGTYNLPEKAFTLPRTDNVCIHAVYAEKPLILKNPMRDMRFSQMPCVKDLGVKFYAGFPVHGPNGEVVASLCAADGVPHNNISTKDYATMEALAKLTSDLVTPKNPAIC